MTSFSWCWCSGENTQSLDCWSSCNVRENIGAEVMEEVCEDDMLNLGRVWC